MRNGILLLLIGLMCSVPFIGNAQEFIIESPDTISVEAPDSTQAIIVSPESVEVPNVTMKSEFKPNSTTAVLLGLIPGAGQIYNRKYWKLPLVYGAFMGCYYAISWNNMNYQDYWNAYRDIMRDDPNDPSSWSQSWMDFVPANRDPKEYINSTYFKDTLKRRKDYYRRYRDMSILIAIGVYAISVIDAYIDAELFNFDISPDLSMRVAPAYMPKTAYQSHTYGFNCSITF